MISVKCENGRTKIRIKRYLTFKIPDPIPCTDKRPLFLIGLILFSLLNPVFAGIMLNDAFDTAPIDTSKWEVRDFDSGSDNVIDIGDVGGEDVLRLMPKGTNGDYVGLDSASETFSKDNGSIIIEFDYRRDDAGTNWAYVALSADNNGYQFAVTDDILLTSILLQAGSLLFKGYSYKNGVSSNVDLGTPVATTWYNVKMEINSDWTNISYYVDDVYKGSITSNIPDDVDLYVQLYARRAGTDAKVYVKNFVITDSEINPYGNYNATLITDNSTSHFVKFNTTHNLNFNSFNATGSSLSGLQMLNVTCASLGINQYNLTSGSNLAVTFNNTEVFNHTCFVQNFYNSSTSLTANFISANVYNISETYNSSLMIGYYNPINFTYDNSSQLTAFTVDEFINWNNTFYAGTDNAFDVTSTEGVAQNFTFYSLVNVTYGADTLTFNSTAKNQTFYTPFIDNCSVYSTYALNISWIDEVNESSVLTDSNIFMSVTLDDASTLDFNITSTNQSEVSVCIYPSWAEYDFDSTIYYDASGYYAREYYYSNSELNNQTKLLTLYMLSTSVGDRLDFIVEDALSNALENYKVIVKRWYPATNSYVITDEVLTDANGEGSVFVQYSGTSSVYYEVLAHDTTDTPVYTASRLRFYDAVQEYTIKLTENITSYWDRLDDFVYTSNADDVINGTTNVFTATVTDVTGNTLSADVYVWEYINSVKYPITCNSSGVSASVTVMCDLGNVTNRVFYAEAWAYDVSNPSNNLIVASEWIYRDSAPTFDNEGLLLGLIMLGACIFLGSSLGSLSDTVGSTVVGSLLGFLIGIIGVKITNLIYFNPSTFSYLLGLVLVVLGIVIWRRE